MVVQAELVKQTSTCLSALQLARPVDVGISAKGSSMPECSYEHGALAIIRSIVRSHMQQRNGPSEQKHRQ